MSSSQWKIVYTKQGLKDKNRACESGFKAKVNSLIELVMKDPYAKYPPYEKLCGDLSGAYSRRVNRQHRFVYQIYEQERTVKIICLWTQYE